MAYVGNKPLAKYATLTSQTFSTPTGTSHVLSHTVTNSDDLLLYINNVKQNPADYTASGTTLTTASLAGGTEMYCLYYGKTTETVAVPASSVGDSHMVDMAASKLTGTIADARFPATLPASSGVNLTALNASNIASGTIASARLPAVGAWTFISETVASNSATISITSGITSTYDLYMVVITNLDPATTDTELDMLVSTDGGSAYRTSGYRESSSRHGVGSARDDYVNTSATSLQILGGSGANESLNAGNRGGNAIVYIPNPSDTGEKTQIWWQGGFHTNGNEQQSVIGTGCYDSAAEDLDAVRFQMESGNISTGNFALYGLKNS